MSFAEQERALLDLLFDATLRERFVAQREQALTGYDLSAAERADFAGVRTDALELDAKLRVDLILQRMCRALPVSFSIASSLSDGLDQLRALIDSAYVRTSAGDRATHLGRQLRAKLTGACFASTLEQAAAVAVCDAELSMVLTAASLRHALLSAEPAANTASAGETAPGAGWEDAPLVIAAHVSIAVLSQSYTAIKRALCPVADAELWPRLCATPLPAARRSQTLAHESPRLLVVRAHASDLSRCEVTIDHRMLELSPGFAPLLGQLNGKTSLSSLQRELTRAGAAERVCQGVRAGFRELLGQGMIATR